MNEAPKSSLDHAFPSLLAMGLLFGLAILLIAITGWKIFMLDQEQQDIAQERLLLERDRDEFLTYGSELPQIKEEHRANMEQVALLKNRRRALQEEISDLNKTQAALKLETDTLTGTITALTGQTQTLREELARDTAELEKLKPALAATRKDLEILKAQETALKESILQKQKDEATLVARIAALERTRHQAEEFLAKLEADKDIYNSTQNNFREIMGAFEAMLARSETLTREYAAKLEDMAQFKSTLDKGMAALTSDTQALASNLDSIRQDRTAHAALLKQGTSQMTQMQAELEGIAATNKKFTAIMESVQGLDKKFQDALTTEVKNIARMAGEDAETRAALSAVTLSLTQSVDGIRKDQAATKDQSGQLSSLLARHQTELNKLATLAQELEAHSEKSRETALSGIKSTASLAESAQKLHGQAEKLHARLDIAEMQSSQIEKVAGAEREKLEELAQLSREVRNEINSSQRVNEEVKAALAEILALLRPASPQARPAEVERP